MYFSRRTFLRFILLLLLVMLFGVSLAVPLRFCRDRLFFVRQKNSDQLESVSNQNWSRRFDCVRAMPAVHQIPSRPRLDIPIGCVATGRTAPLLTELSAPRSSCSVRVRGVCRLRARVGRVRRCDPAAEVTRAGQCGGAGATGAWRLNEKGPPVRENSRRSIDAQVVDRTRTMI